MREIKLLKYSGIFIFFILIYYVIHLNRISNYGIEIFPLDTKFNHQLNLPTVRDSNKSDANILSHRFDWNFIINKTSQNKYRSYISKVIVFVHIQKTGGTLIERRLVKDGIVNRTCQCFDRKMRCLCKNQEGHSWIFSRYSTGWACGLHADLTELKECVNSKLDKIDRRKIQRTYDYFTILREPVNRFISEWLHVKRGSAWHSASLRCHNKSPPTEFYQPCYALNPYTNYRTRNSTQQFKDWSDVPLNVFLQCPYNLASNRQTRMLANLSRLGCYQDLIYWTNPISDTTPLSYSQSRLLESAKFNLIGFLACFGFNEHLIYSQYLIQKRLGIVFNRLLIDLDFLNRSLIVPTHASLVWSQFNQTQLIQIQNANRLDFYLYAFARRIFLLRLIYQIQHDSGLPYRFHRIISTLWLSKNSTNLTGLENLILIGSQPECFRFRLNFAIMNLLVRRGSKHASLEDLKREHWKRLKKLNKDLITPLNK